MYGIGRTAVMDPSGLSRPVAGGACETTETRCCLGVLTSMLRERNREMRAAEAPLRNFPVSFSFNVYFWEQEVSSLTVVVQYRN